MSSSTAAWGRKARRGRLELPVRRNRAFLPGGQPDRSSPRSTAPITTRSGSTRAAEPALWQWRTVVLALHCQHAHRPGAREQLSNDRGGVEWRCDDCAHFRPPSRDGSTETAPGGQKTPSHDRARAFIPAHPDAPTPPGTLAVRRLRATGARHDNDPELEIFTP